MNWTKTEIQGTEVDSLIRNGVMLGYVQYNNERSLWRLYRGDGELFFQVYSRHEAMRILEEIGPSLEFQLCPQVKVGA